MCACLLINSVHRPVTAARLTQMLLCICVFQAALESKLCERIYLTEIMKEFECDVFLPEFDRSVYQPIRSDFTLCYVLCCVSSFERYAAPLLWNQLPEYVHEPHPHLSLLTTRNMLDPHSHHHHCRCQFFRKSFPPSLLHR